MSHVLAFNFNGTWGNARSAISLMVFLSVKQLKWAACFNSDWLVAACHDMKSADLRKATGVTGSTKFSADLAFLDAICSISMAAPVSWNLCFCLKTSKISQRIAQFESLTRRKQLRSFARPLFVLFSKLLAIRKAAGGNISFRSGESAPIFVAGFQLASTFLNRPAQVQSTPLEFGDYNVFASTADGVIVSDVRRKCMEISSQLELESWRESSTQSLFASASARDLFDSVAKRAYKCSQVFIMRLLTDTLHWRSRSVDGKLEVFELKCSHCSAVANASHLLQAQCGSFAHIQEMAKSKLLDHLSAFEHGNSWTSALVNSTLQAIVHSFFEGIENSAACQIGAFSFKEFLECIYNRLGSCNVNLAAKTFLQFRKTLVEAVFDCWVSEFGPDLA
jgi:hypothetical protein